MLCGDLNGKEIQGREDICKCTAGSVSCIAEINTTLNGNNTQIKKKDLSC